MNILQVIDTLKLGGAEKMAVNIANLVNEKGHRSFLMATREGGNLELAVDPAVTVKLIHKKNPFDFSAFLNALKFVRSNKIDVIHAHSSSVFWMLLIKISQRNIKLIWHDHSSDVNAQKNNLRMFSGMINGIICVNEIQRKWSTGVFKKIDPSHIMVLPNFTKVEKASYSLGRQANFRIINIANIRPPKDQVNLLSAFKAVLEFKPDCELLIVGDHESDKEYSGLIFKYIGENHLKDHIIFTGSVNNIYPYVMTADLGVISSSTEGLPVSIIELGLSEVPVISTAVGDIPALLNYGEFGTLVTPQNSRELANAIKDAISETTKMKEKALLFKKFLENNYSPEAFWVKYFKLINEI